MLIPAPAAPVKGASRAGKDNSDDDGAAAASAGAGAAVNPVQPVGAPLVLNMPDINRQSRSHRKRNIQDWT